MKIDDQLARHLQDRGVDLAKLAEFDNTDAGKAAAERFQQMCDRGEIIHSAKPVTIADIIEGTEQ